MSNINGTTSGLNVTDDAQSQNVILTATNKDSKSPKRLLHNSLLKDWRKELKENGFAVCSFATCNFICLNIKNIQNHYLVCDGVPIYNENLCDKCGKYLPSCEELLDHKKTCKGMFRSKSHKRVDHSKNQIATRCREWGRQIKKVGEAHCGYKECNFIGMKMSDLKNHLQGCEGIAELGEFHCLSCGSRFQCSGDCEKHKTNCKTSENVGSMRVSVIKRVKDFNEDQTTEQESELSGDESKDQPDYTRKQKKSWVAALKKSKYVMCTKKDCRFIAMSLEDMASHFECCNGDGSFAQFSCPHCGGRTTREEILAKHMKASHSDLQFQESSVLESGENAVNNDGELISEKSTRKNQNNRKRRRSSREDDECDGAVEEPPNSRPKRRGRKPRQETTGGQERPVVLEGRARRESSYGREKVNAVEEMKAEVEDNQPKKRGRKPKKRHGAVSSGPTPDENESVKCGKCDFEGMRKDFVVHNMKKHVGLGWVEGETPVDMDDEKLLIRLVKEAFKLTKKATCENCQDVKRSFLGFVTHIQNCGKTMEEKDALRVHCPHCTGKYLKYSLPVHIKLSHSDSGEPEKEVEKAEVVSGKRRSALKAVTKFQESLGDEQESEAPLKARYFLCEKNMIDKLPKLCMKLNNLWYKLRRENQKIPCHHDGCKIFSDDVKDARLHHYSCPLLPERVYMCESCDFYSEDEAAVKSHVTVHRRSLKQRKESTEEDGKKTGGEDEEGVEDEDGADEEDEEDEDEDEEYERSDCTDVDGPRKRSRREGDDGRRRKKKPTGRVEADELTHRLNFCRREKLENDRGFQFYTNGLEMMLEEEVDDAESWPELQTNLRDWRHIPPEMASLHFPELTRSISVGTSTGWRKLKRFEGELVDGVPVMFLGGSVRSMSWCRVSAKRALKKAVRQYLAVSTDRSFEHFKDIHQRFPLSKSCLLQVWDCGILENAPAEEPPKLALGVIHETGEIWDLTWLPEDTFAEGTDERLPRLGLLATASQDGAVRLWSICDPSHLPESTNGFPIYETEPVAKLITDETFEESCLRVSVCRDGVLAAGYNNGVLALWNLKNIASPFCKRVGRCRIIKAHAIIQAHRAAVTAVALCPRNSRYVVTGSLDRLIKLWDLEAPFAPTEQTMKELCLDVTWPRHWPLLLYSFDDVLPGSHKGVIKFVRDLLNDRTQSCFSMDGTCLSFSFNDWLNILCASSTTGEIKVRFLKNFIGDQKRIQNTLTSVFLERLSKEGEGKIGRTYEEVAATFGLIFKDDQDAEKTQAKGKKSIGDDEEPPVRAANKVAFNPNFESFTHVAEGYNCGLLRIQPLKELQGNRSLKYFLEKTRRRL